MQGSCAKLTIEQAYDSYGKLDTRVNNAGVLRDRMSFNVAEATSS